MNNSFSKPIKIFLKIDPDTNFKRLEEIVEVSVKFKLDGLIATNTTVSRNNLNSKNKNEKGGLSGRPIFSISTKRLAELFSISSGEIPLIGVGGIFSGEDAYEKIKAGASALQIYTAIGYKGIGVIEEIVRSLDTLLEKDGVQSIKSVTGIDHKKWLS
jgi:dihydroorotate dehydrogenase